MCFMTCDALPLGLLTCHPCDCCIHTPILAIAFSPYTFFVHSHLSKVFGNVKKSLYNQPKPYFFKTFGIVYSLFVYLLIMFI